MKAAFISVICLFLLCFSVDNVLGQEELMNELLNSDITKYVNETEVDECANASLNACQKSCVNGTYPPYGYTCTSNNGKTIQVDYATKILFKQISQALMSLTTSDPQSLTTIIDITLSGSTASYTFGTNRTWTPTEQFAIPYAAPGTVASQFKTLLGIDINAKRITITAPSTPELQISLQFPTLVAIVSWTSAISGDLTQLRDISLVAVGKNASSKADQVRLFCVYNSTTTTVQAKWLEDIAAAPGTDTTYKDLACTYFGKQINKTVDVASCGFAYDLNSLTDSDTTCRYKKPGSPNSVPSPQPNPAPPGTKPPPNGQPSNAFAKFLSYGLVWIVVLYWTIM
jgi:hypothetical protein